MLYSSNFFGFLACFLLATKGLCPFEYAGTPLPEQIPDKNIPPQDVYNEALEELNLTAVFDDIYELMDDSQTCWPADDIFGETSYAGLFLRLSWHCSGTYRTTDGLGGCTGADQRFPPESAWEDNTNLDKARALLAPIKEKYGDALSWGDLFIFGGDAAVLKGGGPITKVCAGRVDDVDGSKAEPLNDTSTCNDEGADCQPPTGTSTVGLIYVNPEGVNGVPDPTQSAANIRDIFGRMGMNDTETVALIGGGHAFGKTHGACPLGPGPNPLEDPYNPWPGACDNGTFTSGFEGPWTSSPFSWDNQYFELLLNNVNDYELVTGPGGKYQWNYSELGLMMLTTDISLMYDSEGIYQEIVKEYATNIDSLNTAFDAAWLKLTTSGGTMAQNAFCVPAELVMPPERRKYYN